VPQAPTISPTVQSTCETGCPGHSSVLDSRRWEPQLTKNACWICAVKALARETLLPPQTNDLLPKMKELTDEQLMAHLKVGQGDALTVLFDRYHRLVLSIALKIVRDQGEAEDVMQSVFLEIFRAAAQFDPAKGTTKTWLLQYAYHRAINRRQQLTARHFYQGSSIEDVETHTAEPSSMLGRFSHPELQHLLRQALTTLSRQQRQVLELASYDGLSMSEIAQKTGESLSNVRHYYYRGLKKLRSFIDGGQEGTHQHDRS
jgi:RNA polymerase sigma-70 factor (ECF subfamily)